MSDLDTISATEFPQSDDLYYLNHAAVSPWPKRTVDAVQKFAQENLITGAKNYPKWVQKETELRCQLAELINAPTSDEIALLKNTSEAISVVAEGLAWQAGDVIVSSDQEFPSNRIPWQAQSKHGVLFHEVDLNSADTPEQALIDACDDRTKLLTVSSVQYASGLRLDLQRLGNFCKQHAILFCVDAIQSLGVHKIDVKQCHIDFLMADAHKWLMGPEGIAVFYCREEKQNILELRQFGWHMIENAGNYSEKLWVPANNSKRFECGSPNMLGIHALSASVSLIHEIGQDSIENAIRVRIDLILNSLNTETYEILSATESQRRAGIVTFKKLGVDTQKLHQQLMAGNIICAYRGGGIRLSPHFYTSFNKIKKALEIINITN